MLKTKQKPETMQFFFCRRVSIEYFSLIFWVRIHQQYNAQDIPHIFTFRVNSEHELQSRCAEIRFPFHNLITVCVCVCA